jgi:hypothetical protein
MSSWESINSAPKNRVFLAWDGERRFLCAWDFDQFWWCVAASDAPQDLAEDREGRIRTADPILWTDLPGPPSQARALCADLPNAAVRAKKASSRLG